MYDTLLASKLTRLLLNFLKSNQIKFKSNLFASTQYKNEYNTKRRALTLAISQAFLWNLQVESVFVAFVRFCCNCVAQYHSYNEI